MHLILGYASAAIPEQQMTQQGALIGQIVTRSLHRP